MEVELSRLVAKSADHLLQKNIAEAKQEQIAQQEQDPLIQMQQQFMFVIKTLETTTLLKFLLIVKLSPQIQHY